MQKGVILGCGNRSIAGMDTITLGHSNLPPFLCQEGPLNTIFDEIVVIPMNMES
jgi:hypothetical protein